MPAPPPNILIAGCGRLGHGLAEVLAASGHRPLGLRRSPPTDAAFPYLAVDLNDPASLRRITGGFELAYVILPPASRDREGYRIQYTEVLPRLLDHLAGLNPAPRCIYVSSTRVYAQQTGEWVDETSICAPEDEAAQYLLAAERRVAEYRENSIVMRFSGIYGGARRGLLASLQRADGIQRSPAYYTNRIHEEDCIGALAHLGGLALGGESLHPLYLGSDLDPAPRWEIAEWFAAQGWMEPKAPLDLAQDAPANKRCDSARLQGSGYRFRYAGFREGYDTMTDKMTK